MINYQWAEHDFDSAWHYALQVEAIGRATNNKYILRTALNAKGIAYDYQNRFDSAIYFCGEARKLAQQIGDLNGQASSILNFLLVPITLKVSRNFVTALSNFSEWTS